MRGQIFFISIVDISSWPQLCFELILLIILDTVSCSNKLNWKGSVIFFFLEYFYSYVYVLRNVCREGWANILKKKELKLFAMSSLLSILSPSLTKYDVNSFLLLHLLSNSLMVVHVWGRPIPVTPPPGTKWPPFRRRYVHMQFRVFWFKFHWRSFLRVQLTTTRRWFR